LAAVLALLVPLVVLAEAVRPELVHRAKEMLAAQQRVVDMAAVAAVVLEVQVAQA
jgi:inhibitor of KinA sporulation pathway (predicted exonuclease)